MIEATIKPNEESTGTFQVTFRDEQNALTVPTDVAWTLSDSLGNIINSKKQVPVTPASSVLIVVSGDDLALVDDTDNGERRLLIEWTYDSLSGSGLPGKEEVRFFIAPLVNVPVPP